MHGLKLQPAVQPVEPSGTVDVHCGAELALGKGLCGAEVGGRHAPVGEGDLDVQEHGDAVGYEDESYSRGPGREGEPDEAVAEEEPVGEHCEDFDWARPACGAKVGGAGGDEMAPGEEVEIEAGDGHDGVVDVCLVGDEDVAGGVPDEGEVVVGADDGAEVGWRSCEEWDILDIGVVFLYVLDLVTRECHDIFTYWHICDEMVDVVRGLPPTKGEATA